MRSPAPSANRISVKEGDSDTTRRARAASGTARPASSRNVTGPRARARAPPPHAAGAGSQPAGGGLWATGRIAKIPPPTERRWESVCAERSTPPSLPRGNCKVARTETSPGFGRRGSPSRFPSGDESRCYCPLQWRGRAGFTPASVDPRSQVKASLGRRPPERKPQSAAEHDDQERNDHRYEPRRIKARCAELDRDRGARGHRV